MYPCVCQSPTKGPQVSPDTSFDRQTVVLCSRVIIISQNTNVGHIINPPLISVYQVYSRRKQFTNYTYRLGKKGGSGMGPVERQFSCQE
jgi:hypothetical protein